MKLLFALSLAFLAKLPAYSATDVNQPVEYIVEENIDYKGNDIAFIEPATLESCKAYCENTPGCLLFTYNKHLPADNSVCWLKGGFNGRKQTDDRDTYIIKSNLPGRTYQNIDNIRYEGYDLFFIENATPTQCEARCDRTPGCTLFAYRRAQNGCWLKHAYGNPVVDGAWASRVVINSEAPTPRIYVAHDNMDMEENDVVELGEGATIQSCMSMCDRTTGCLAFTWDKGGQNKCWLKSGFSNRAVEDSRVTYVIRTAPAKQYVEGEFSGEDLFDYKGSWDDCPAVCDTMPGCKAYIKFTENNMACKLLKPGPVQINATWVQAAPVQAQLMLQCGVKLDKLHLMRSLVLVFALALLSYAYALPRQASTGAPLSESFHKHLGDLHTNMGKSYEKIDTVGLGKKKDEVQKHVKEIRTAINGLEEQVKKFAADSLTLPAGDQLLLDNRMNHAIKKSKELRLAFREKKLDTITAFEYSKLLEDVKIMKGNLAGRHDQLTKKLPPYTFRP